MADQPAMISASPRKGGWEDLQLPRAAYDPPHDWVGIRVATNAEFGQGVITMVDEKAGKALVALDCGITCFWACSELETV